jgi:hypothetical protein
VGAAERQAQARRLASADALNQLNDIRDRVAHVINLARAINARVGFRLSFGMQKGPHCGVFLG